MLSFSHMSTYLPDEPESEDIVDPALPFPLESYSPAGICWWAGMVLSHPLEDFGPR